MGFKAFRLSISWSPIFPKGDELTPNEEGLALFDRVFDELRKYNIEPVVTISHYELPVHLIKEYDGWRSRKLVAFFERYVTAIFNRYNNKVKYWMIFNEINSSLHMPILGLGFAIQKEEDHYQPPCQAYHHQFVARGLSSSALSRDGS